MQVAEGQAAVYRCQAAVDFLQSEKPFYPVTASTDAEYALMREVGAKLYGENNIATMQPVMGAEDFAFFLEQIPGAYMLIGSKDPNRASAGAHSSKFWINEEVLPYGAALLSAVAEKYLQNAATSSLQAQS